MNISFDPAKNARNIEERNLSFERAEDFEPETAMTRLYLRNGELRAFSVGYLDDRLHVLCFKKAAFASSVSDERIPERQSAMDSRYVDDLIDDDEIPELTEEDFAQSVPFHQLPASMQSMLLALKHATIRPDPVRKPVTVALSSDILDRFTATGEGWETRVDNALRQWLDEHPLPAEHAKAS